MVQTIDGHMQGPIISLTLDGYLLIGEGEVIVGGNIVDDATKALHRYVLGDVGFVQDLDQQHLMQLRIHE